MLLYDHVPRGETVSRASHRLNDVPPQLVRPPSIPRSRQSIGPHRTARTEELFLVWHLAGMLRLDWELSTLDPVSAIDHIRGFAAATIKSHQREQLRDLLSEITSLQWYPAEAPQTQMLLAATRWLCGFALPCTMDDLWFGPPVISVERARTRR